MDNIRIGRISQEVKKVISKAISFDLKDPKVSDKTSVTDVKVSNDLSYADIYVTVMGTEWDKNQTIDGLENAEGYLKNSIATGMNIRQIPELRFHLDESIEYGMYMDKLIEETIAKDEKNAAQRNKRQSQE